MKNEIPTLHGFIISWTIVELLVIVPMACIFLWQFIQLRRLQAQPELTKVVAIMALTNVAHGVSVILLAVILTKLDSSGAANYSWAGIQILLGF